MPSASTIRLQIESALAHRIPSALTPQARIVYPVAPTSVAAVDELLEGGLPLGAITELVGPESSGRTSLALSFVAGIARAGSVCAWIDVSDTLHPESAAAVGVDLARLLWVRCGVMAATQPVAASYKFALPARYHDPPPAVKGLHCGGCGGHPRNETKGLAEAVSGLLKPEAIAPRCAEPQRRVRPEREVFAPHPRPFAPQPYLRTKSPKPWSRIEQALRVADLLLQAGGFRAIVLDLGSIAPEFAARVPLATWFRYRAAAERTQASLLLLTQHPCAKSSAELLLRLEPGQALDNETTVFTGVEHHLEVERRRFSPSATNVVPLRKPPQRASAASWRTQPAWAGPR
jgi:recombination protein RecA